MITCKRTK